MLNCLFDGRNSLIPHSPIKMRHNRKLNRLNDRYFQNRLKCHEKKEKKLNLALWIVLAYAVPLVPSGVLKNTVVN